MSFSDFYNSIASPELKAVARHWNEIKGSPADTFFRKRSGKSRLDVNSRPKAMESASPFARILTALSLLKPPAAMIAPL
jgi:hypothetical protein